MQDLERPPKNKLRKVVFKDGSGLSKVEKLKIVGQLVGRSSKINNETIYECMLELHDIGNKITINLLAKMLKCSSRTIHRNMSEDLKQEKDLLNIENEKI
jgi:predicted HTH transcriptional regulator